MKISIIGLSLGKPIEYLMYIIGMGTYFVAIKKLGTLINEELDSGHYAF